MLITTFFVYMMNFYSLNKEIAENTLEYIKYRATSPPTLADLPAPMNYKECHAK